MSNMIKTKEFATINKMMNTIFGKLSYLSKEDIDKINEIDNEILLIDRKLKDNLLYDSNFEEFNLKNCTDVIWGKDSKVSQFVEMGQGLLKIFSALTDADGNNGIGQFYKTKDKTSMNQVKERQELVKQRNDIIFESKEKMRIEHPKEFELITEQLCDMQLQFSKGEFDMMKMLTPNVQ